VFSERPYSEARVTDITAAARVSTGSYYTYFDSKEELFRVIAAGALDEISSAPTRSPDNPKHNPVLDIAYASRQFFLTCFRHRSILRSVEVLQGSDGEVHLSRHGTLVGTAKKVERWVQRLQADGYCDPTIDAWYTATALISMNISLGYAQLVHRDDIDKIDALVNAVTPIWARAVGLDAWLASDAQPSEA
jgi:AcrR family transcriptional regulator